MSAEVTNKIFTLPNLISLIRLFLVPVFAIALVAFENNILAFIVFVVAASTDFLDGAIARSTGQVSRLGQQLDPLVDRVLILTAVILIFLIGRVPFWVLLVIVARDLSMLVLIGQLKACKLPKLEVAFVGKAGTALNMAGFALLILYWPIVPGLGIIEASWLPGWGSAEAPLGIWFIYVGMILAWAAGIYYMIRAYRQSLRPPKGGGNGSPQKRGASSATARRSESALQNGQRSSALQDSRRSDTLQKRSYEDELHQSRNKLQQTATRTRAQTTKRTNSPARSQGHKGRSGSGGKGVFRVLNTPKKIIAATAALLFIVAAIGFYTYDTIVNYGVVHAGVKVGDTDISRMETSEAATLINSELNAVANASEVVIYADDEAAEAGRNDTTVQLGNGVNVYNQTELDHEVTSWSVTLGTFDAEVNGAALAERAYGVGRNDDFVLGRLAANTLGVTITPTVDYAIDRLHSVENMLTESIGTPMNNASISFDGTRFIAADGQDGYVVDEEEFETRLNQAFLSSDKRELVVPMVDRAMQVTLEDAEKVAQQTQDAISEPVLVSYGEASWKLEPSHLGQIVTAVVEEDDKGGGTLVPKVDIALLEALLPQIIGHLEDQVAPLNAEFVVVEGELQIIPSQNGTGVNYQRLASDLEMVLFNTGAEEESEAAVSEGGTADIPAHSRSVQISIGVLEPELKTSDAEAYGFSNKISEFTIEFPWVADGTITNVHVASDLLNSSIIEPQATWSFNDTAGECTPEKGFVDAGIILGDEYVDDIGGGICNVASAVFNAAYEGGYPIVERVNHSLRLTRYPAGRDAAIAFPWADLKFQNDTDNYVLLTMSYSDWTVTCTLWGESPGYVVESVAGELIEGEEYKTKEVEDEYLAPGQTYIEQAGKNASKIEVTRTVYYADGSLKEQRTFYSSYDATPEIIKVGPEESTSG